MKHSEAGIVFGCSTRARAGLASALSILLLAATTPQSAAQTENFDDGNDTSPVYWQHYTLPAQYYGATTYSFPADDNGGKAYSLSAAPTGSDPYGLKNARGGSFPALFTYTNRFIVGSDLLAWATTGRPNSGLMWYIHDVGLGTTDGYVATYSPAYGNVYISVVTNEAQQAYFCRLEDYSITLDPTNRIRMVASSHDGYTFLFTIYNLAEPNTPWASLIGADATWYGYGGYSGYLVMNEDYPATYGAGATFDNYFASEPAAGTMPAVLTDVYPPPAGKSKRNYFTITNSVTIMDRDTIADSTSIVLCLDGKWLANQDLTVDPVVYKQYNPAAYQQYFSGATATYAITNILPWGSKHTNIVAYKDSTTWYTNTWTWTVDYPCLMATNSLPLGSLNARGFDVRVAQTANGGTNMANTLARARQQLDGLVAVDQRATNTVQYLNWNKASAYPDNVPGLCPGSTINIAAASCAYLQLTAGMHRFRIITDDRSGMYSGSDFGYLADANTSAIWEAPNSMANTTFDFYVEADGLYPVTFLWEETAGSANLAVYSVNLEDSTETLINDPTDPAGVVKAWYPVVCKSSASAGGNFTLAASAANVLSNVETVGSSCGSAVVGLGVKGGTLTIPVTNAAQFYRLEAPRQTKVTGITKNASTVVIDYQFR